MQLLAILNRFTGAQTWCHIAEGNLIISSQPSIGSTQQAYLFILAVPQLRCSGRMQGQLTALRNKPGTLRVCRSMPCTL